jgi:UDP-N-acetylglucosamine 2-epimerase (non-hydrolysing)
MDKYFMKIDIIAGARPNFIKIAPIIEAISSSDIKNLEYRLVHTGQHYDQKMSGSFFEELRIPKPDVNLGAGGGTQAEQTAAIMIGYERLLENQIADVCLVVGDVTSTMACSIVAKKKNLKVLHVEGGIRSFDLTMPEEINRMVTDSITDYFYTTSRIANSNLLKLGIDSKRIQFVGNTMIDTLLKNINNLKRPQVADRLKLAKKNYFILTLHRPANVDGEKQLSDLLLEVVKYSRDLPIIFPVHPRTEKIIRVSGMNFPNLHFIEPLGYLNFIYLVKNSKAVITDSGGITEETTVLGIPCLTLRNNTERPETVFVGTNELIGTKPQNIGPAMEKLWANEWKKGGIPEFWDGKAAERIISHLVKLDD